MIKVVDISYGGENGFNQAIELAADALADVKFIKEKKLIQAFFDEISQDTNKAVYGVQETLTGLEMGAIETLICWENLDTIRFIRIQLLIKFCLTILDTHSELRLEKRLFT